MTKIVVAMSGGVDSSVAAALLKKQGYEVIGMMLRLWSEPGKEDSNRCCTPDAMAQARRVAAILDIPFYVLDAKEIFRSTVVQYFLDGYAQGVTPNPCLICNRVIRWEFMLDHALALGADFMATGHYVRKMKDESGKMKLLRAADASKDQSYVLHGLTQEKLAKSLFPIGDYPKSEIRRLAESFGLPTATRADSQDLCFLAGDDYRDFIRRNAPAAGGHPGAIITREGKTLGEHLGLAYYTIGQRKGLGAGLAQPIYVLAKDAAANSLIVGRRDELGSHEMIVKDINWISGEAPKGSFRTEVKIRYTAKEAWAEIASIAGERQAEAGPACASAAGTGERSRRVRFDAPQRDITPGQAAVFYAGEVLLGGGIIV
ncbi:MAG: tRNA 2-thiouridine(34) synthase MnmA [Anaerolineales bacterium]|nr:tRNA 2-thiouridine(34) synthase MnmA [Anaerolineales bacterium]